MIGLAGKSGSGKDTAFKMIKELIPNAVKVSFADALKEAAAVIIGCSKKDFESREFRESRLDGFYMTGREFLQSMGQALRDRIDMNVWVKAAMNRALHLRHDMGKFPVFTDVRYPNEVSAIQENDGSVFLLKRWCSYNTWAELHDIEQRQVSDTPIRKEDFILLARKRDANVSSLIAESEVALDDFNGFDGVIEAHGIEELNAGIERIIKTHKV